MVPVSVTDALFARHPELFHVEPGVALQTAPRVLAAGIGRPGLGSAHPASWASSPSSTSPPGRLARTGTELAGIRPVALPFERYDFASGTGGQGGARSQDQTGGSI